MTVTTAVGEPLLTVAEACKYLKCRQRDLIRYIDNRVVDVHVVEDGDRQVAMITLASLLEFDPRYADADVLDVSLAQVAARQDWRSALEELSPSAALELVASRSVKLAVQDRPALRAKARELQATMDRAAYEPDQPRPDGIPEHATARSITTALGKIPLWYWPTRTAWMARAGGPRTLRKFRAIAAREAIRLAGQSAREAYGRRTTGPSRRTRFLILKRDGFACRYCGRKAPEAELRVDHIVPVAEGGTDAPDNLGAACAECNGGKSDLLL